MLFPNHQPASSLTYRPVYSNHAAAASTEGDYQDLGDDWVREQIEGILKTLSPGNLEPESAWGTYLNKIDAIRETGLYKRFLELSPEYNSMVVKAILNSMMRYSHDELKPGEEEYLLKQLSSGDLSVQEVAVGVLDAWGKFSDIDKLENISIGDKFLQEDLLEYINERRTT